MSLNKSYAGTVAAHQISFAALLACAALAAGCVGQPTVSNFDSLASSGAYDHPGMQVAGAMNQLPAAPGYAPVKIGEGAHGAVDIEALLNVDGTVDAARAIGGEQWEWYAVSGVEEMMGSHFQPCTLGGNPVKCRITRRYSFTASLPQAPQQFSGIDRR